MRFITMGTKRPETRIVFIFPLLAALVILIPSEKPAAETPDYSVSFNGKLILPESGADYRAISDNGLFYCRYDVAGAGDEIRELTNFRLYEDGNLLYSLDKAPGSDLYISYSGITAFLDHTFHFNGELSVIFYSENGDHLYSKKFTGASLFGFSPSGEMFGVGTAERLFVISPRSQKVDEYNSGYQFDISTDGEYVVVAGENRIYGYAGGNLVQEIPTNAFYPRGIKISPDNGSVSLIDKKILTVFSLDGSVIFADTLGEKMSFRDLLYDQDEIVTGIHYRDKEYSRGIIRIYNPALKTITEKEESSKYIKSPPPPENIGNSQLDYDPIPWPFAPFDSMCTVWNHYEQHMSYGEPDWSYLHQGLDMITAIGEHVYAVQGGVVKCVLTIGGSYWRMASARSRIPAIPPAGSTLTWWKAPFNSTLEIRWRFMTTSEI
jgi:hypothetical protein